MAEHTFYIDCDRGQLVTSEGDNTPKRFPLFVQGDTALIRIYLLTGYNRGGDDYDVIPTDGLTLQVAIGNLSGSLIYTAQYTWTANEGLYFEAELPMNTAEITTALGSQTSKQATLEIKYLREGVPTTVLQEEVSIKKALILPGTSVPIPDPTYLTAEAAVAMFARLTESRAIHLEGANGSLIKLWNDDSEGSATFKADNEA